MKTVGIIATPSNFPVPVGSKTASTGGEKNPPAAKKTSDSTIPAIVTGGGHKR